MKKFLLVVSMLTFATISVARADDVPATAAKKENSDQEFTRRRGEVKDADVDGLFSLYTWAKANGIKKTKTDALLRDILKVKPDHAQAREILGYVKYHDEWVTAKEKERREIEDQRKEMEAKGMVLVNGKWVTKEEKEKAEHEAAGEVLVEGVWVKKADAEKEKADLEKRKEAEEHKAKGEFLAGDKWVPKADAEKYYADPTHPYESTGEHVIVRTTKGIDFGDKWVITAEGVYRRAKEFFGKEPNANTGKLEIFVASDLNQYNEIGNQLNADEKSSNYHAYTSPWLADPVDKKKMHMTGVSQYFRDPKTSDIYLCHAAGELYVQHLLGPNAADAPPRWFIDGMASYFELWQDPKLFPWSRDNLRSMGDILKLKTLIQGYTPTEQQVRCAGLLIAFMKSPDCPADLSKEFGNAVTAVADGQKISKAFRTLEKALLKSEDAFVQFANK